MAKHTLDEERPGYYLPEDSQQRLVRLSDHIKFLLRLMQPLADAVGEPARRAAQACAPAHEAAGGAKGYTFGVTLAQIDTLDGLLRTLAAHGDVVASGDAAGFADGTLPSIGRAVFDAAAAVRGVIDAVETQRLAAGTDARSRVEEARAVYVAPRAVPARLSKDRALIEAELAYGDYLH